MIMWKVRHVRSFLDVEAVRCDAKRYASVKREIVGKRRGFRAGEWWLPANEKLEEVMALGFARSNKWLAAPIEWYVCGKRSLRVYQFNCTNVMVETDARKGLVEMRVNNIDSRFMFALMAGLMGLNPAMGRVIDRYADARKETLRLLSDSWKRYVDAGKVGSFGVWVRREGLVGRLVRYRQKHVVRDDVWNVPM